MELLKDGFSTHLHLNALREDANSAACCINLRHVPDACQRSDTEYTKAQGIRPVSTLALRLQGDAAGEVAAGTGGPDELRSQPARSS
jgi:hypothetical protein